MKKSDRLIKNAYTYQLTLTSKGQITIPVALRKHFGLLPGSRLRLAPQRDGTVSIAPMDSQSGFDKVAGSKRMGGAQRSKEPE